MSNWLIVSVLSQGIALYCILQAGRHIRRGERSLKANARSLKANALVLEGLEQRFERLVRDGHKHT